MELARSITHSLAVSWAVFLEAVVEAPWTSTADLLLLLEGASKTLDSHCKRSNTRESYVRERVLRKDSVSYQMLTGASQRFLIFLKSLPPTMKMLRTRLQQFALVISLMVAPLTFHYIVNIQQHARHLSTADNGSGEMEA
jgi:hypothetical protein